VRWKDGLYIIKDNKIFAEKWEFEAEAAITDVVIDKDVYAGSYDGNVYCLDKNGKVKWRYTAGWGISDIETDNKNIYFSSYDGNIYCINRNGDLQWIFSCNASVHHLKAYGSLIFASSSDGRFYAVNKSDGKVEYSFAPAYEIEGIYNYITTPVISNIVALKAKVFFSAAGKIYCLDAQTIEKSVDEKNKESVKIMIGGIVAIILMALAAAFFFRRRE